jgi:uncharacterized protein YacL
VSIEFAFRLVGMIGLAIGGMYFGARLAEIADIPVALSAIVFALVGALVGLVVTPYLTTRPATYTRARIGEMPASVLVAALAGLIVGLIIASLLTLPLSMLPSPFSQILPLVGAVVFSWLGVSIFVLRHRDIFSLFRVRFPRGGTGPLDEKGLDRNSLLLDTSVIIDGRIADVAKTGFITSTLVVPRFVLAELQHIADSPDAQRRNRGRRGLDVLNQMQKEAAIPLKILDLDVQGVREVDDKLVLVAKQLKYAIITNDFNLNHVAQLQGVRVLNVNDLANAVKAVYLPGELLEIEIIQDGKEIGQGVGYLDDGTMVVVDDGRRHMHTTQKVLVTKAFQTAAGRMIFAKMENGNKG